MKKYTISIYETVHYKLYNIEAESDEAAREMVYSGELEYGHDNIKDANTDEVYAEEVLPM